MVVEKPEPRPSARLFAWAILTFAAIVLAYSNSLDNAFHFDDFHTIVDNPAIRSLSNVPRFFTDATTFSVQLSNRTYRPLVSTTLALDYALGHGYVPLWFHLDTLVVFLILIGLLWKLYAQTLRAAGAGPTEATKLWALGAAAWFGLHPAIAETVNYVIQRGDIDCTLGCVAALVWWIAQPSQRKFGFYLLPLAFALLSKPPAAVFPALLLLWVFFFDTQGTATARWRKSFLATIPSLAVTAALMVLQSAMTPKSFVAATLSAADYRRTQPLVWLRYFGSLFLPLHLNVDTDLPAFHDVTPAVLAGFVFVLLLAAAIWFCSRRRQLYPVAYGLLWFVITQLPTSAYTLSEVENDHRMFFSFVGLILAVVWLLRLAAAKLLTPGNAAWLRPTLITCALLALTGYALGVRVRNTVWHTESSLWRDDVLKSPHNGRGLMIYGLTLMNRGDYTGAKQEFETALRYTPNYSTLEVNLGIVDGQLGLTQEAERHFNRALALAPTDDIPHAYYGRWLNENGRYAEAASQARQAIELNPTRALQHEVLIEALSGQGDDAAARQAALDTLQAIPGDPEATNELQHPLTRDAAFWLNRSLADYRAAHYEASEAAARQALQLDPRSAEAHNNIGASEAALGHWDNAVAEEKQALALNPSLAIARNNLAAYSHQGLAPNAAAQPAATAADWVNRSLALNQAGKYQDSIAAAREALQLDPHSAEAWNNIAADNEELHRWDEAIAAARHAIALRPDFQLAKNNLAWSQSQKQAASR